MEKQGSAQSNFSPQCASASLRSSDIPNLLLGSLNSCHVMHQINAPAGQNADEVWRHGLLQPEHGRNHFSKRAEKGTSVDLHLGIEHTHKVELV